MGWTKHCEWTLQFGDHRNEEFSLPIGIQFFASHEEEWVEIRIRYSDGRVDTRELRGSDARDFLSDITRFIRNAEHDVGYLYIPIGELA